VLLVASAAFAGERALERAGERALERTGERALERAGWLRRVDAGTTDHGSSSWWAQPRWLAAC
jgi:hypothetical protein